MALMDYLRSGFVFRSTDPDLEEDEVIPGIEKSREPGINQALGESGKRYREVTTLAPESRSNHIGTGRELAPKH